MKVHVPSTDPTVQWISQFHPPNTAMPFHDCFVLPREDQHDVDPAWFERQRQRSVENLSLRDWRNTQIDALKVFHSDTDANKAALSMTHPISVSPIPELGGYSDEIVAVCELWQIIIAALIEWPSTRIPEIFTLLDAIRKAPGDIHKGEAIGDDGEKLTWAQLPYFGLVWYEAGTCADLQPGQICRQYPDLTTLDGLAQARKLYLKKKDIEAQLVTKHVLRLNRAMIQFIIRALEKIDPSDQQLAPDAATGYSQVKLDFHIPALAFMFKYNEREVYDQVVTKGLGDWKKRQLPDGARDFQNGAERWSFWRRRLEELSWNADDEVKAAAQASLGYMSSCSVARMSA